MEVAVWAVGEGSGGVGGSAVGGVSVGGAGSSVGGDHTKWRAWQEVGYGRHHPSGRRYLCSRPYPCPFSSGVHVVFLSQSHISQAAVRAASPGPCAGTLR